MVLNNRRIQGVLAGGLGGAVSWLLIEPLVAPRLERVTSMSELYPVDALFGALAGICIGAALGIAEGIIVRSAYQARRGGLIGASAGIVGGAIGLVIGEMVFQPLKLLCFVGRSIGWAVFGAFLGAAEGITRRSWKGLGSAALGGTIGGAIGGFMFDLVALFTVLLFGSDALSRGVALTIVGSCIGLWIVLMERVLAPATLKVVSGRFEGREFLLDKPRLTLGSNERGDIAIFGDPQIRGHHATMHHEGRGYVIEAEAGAPVMVNKQPVTRQALGGEDELIIGQTRLIYRDKSGAVSVRPAVQPVPSSMPDLPSAVVSPRPMQRPPVAPIPHPAILWLIDQSTGRRYAVRPGITTIGRSGDNDIVLDAPSVSAHHAEIRYQNGRYILYDRGSTNGTFVNGRRISGPNMIKAGWRVRLGDVELVVAG
jgi:hypothetical protein